MIDSKAAAFRSEYTGKMNFCLAAVADTLKHPTDQPGIADYTHLARLLDELKGSLPTIDEAASP